MFYQNTRTFPMIFIGCKKYCQVIDIASSICVASKPKSDVVSIWRNVLAYSASHTCIPLWIMIQCVAKVTTPRPSCFIMFTLNIKCCYATNAVLNITVTPSYAVMIIRMNKQYTIYVYNRCSYQNSMSSFFL